jgi:hypothetical protein
LPGGSWSEARSVSRLPTSAGAESGYRPDELAAFELLRWAIRKAAPPGDVPGVHRHDAAAGIVSSLPPALYRASMSAAGWSALTVSLMKMQARGQVLPRRAHEWVDLVVGWDFYDREQDFHPVIGIHLPMAVRAGIRPEEIDALRRARVSELEQDDRDLVRLIREIVAGTVSDRSYERGVQLVGSDRGVLELANACVVLVTGHVLARRALRVEGTETHRPFPTTQTEILDLLARLQARNVRLPNIDAYEAAFTTLPWPALPATMTPTNDLWFDRDAACSIGCEPRRPSRSHSEVAAQHFDDDDLTALELLQHFGLIAGFEPVVPAWHIVAGLSPMAALALEMWTVGGMKAQARGKIDRRRRALGGLALAFVSRDGSWPLLEEYVPCALGAGVRRAVVEALANDRLDDLWEDERAVVDFARAIASADVPDATWNRIVATHDAGERAVAEQIMDILLQWTRIRLAQLLDVGCNGDAAKLATLLDPRRPRVDIDALEAGYEAIDWIELSTYTTLADRSRDAS